MADIKEHGVRPILIFLMESWTRSRALRRLNVAA